MRELKAAGIEPMVTLYHWDLPYALYLQGGWKNPQIPDWFAAYTKIVVEALSDQVQYWMTLNEPQCFVGIGHLQGRHAPFLDEPASLRPVTRHVLLAHAKAVQTIRQYPIDNYELTQAMMQIIRNGGLGNGGTNFDAKTRRNSTDLEDIFIAHIAGMDAMARALESAAALLNESPYCKMLSDRYASFDSGKGKEFEEGKLTLEDVVAYAKQNGEPKQVSGKQELYEAIVNMYC